MAPASTLAGVPPHQVCCHWQDSLSFEILPFSHFPTAPIGEKEKEKRNNRNLGSNVGTHLQN